jgi:DNA helicase-2/ATP-dependent DNA helicase PcrA
MLVVAGAGTGKSTILVERLRYLVEKKLARGDEILLLTFTEKGAGEMEDRALEILPYGYFDLWISTFHGFCERILREHALDIGLSSDFKILSSTEQWILIKKNLDLFNLDYYKPLGNPNKFIYELVKHFSRLKDEYIRDSEYLDYSKKINKKKNLGEDEQEDAKRYWELAEAYKIYNQILLNNGYLDFGDLIVYTLKLLETRPAILAFYRDKFKYIMIDEFQDTNWSQFALIKLLAAPKNNLLVVGDDDQSIYKFRGASLSNILQFKDDFPDAKEVVLVYNYRSGQEILDTAYGFIQHNNPNRLEEKIKIDKRLKSGLDLHARVKHLHFANLMDEQEWVIKKIKKIKAENKEATWSDFAILIRANSSADDFVAELNRKHIPNVFVSLRGLYYKSIILDCIAYLKLLDHYHESSALFRVLNMEVFKVGHKDLVAISRFARRKSWSLFETLNNLGEISDISETAVNNIGLLLKLIKKHSVLVQKTSPSRIFAHFVHDARLDQKKYQENLEYFSYLNQFYQKIKKFDNDLPGSRLKDFMELLSMELEAGETGALRLDFDDADMVSIMTAHASKGLEFNYVFIVNLVDKKFPTINRKDKITIPDILVKDNVNCEAKEGALGQLGQKSKTAHIEEERRLFYVALTRAKKHLFLTSAKDCGGVREKKPSIFIKEAKVDTDKRAETKVDNNILLRDIGQMTSPLVGEKIDFALPSKFSFSQIEAYANCPLQYKFNFILKVPTLSKAVFVFGRLMHNTLKDSMLGLINSPQLDMFSKTVEVEKKKSPNLDDLLNNFKKYWNDDGYDTKEDREKYKTSGIEMLKLFFVKMEKQGWPDVLFVEKSFTHNIGGYFFKGSIDRVDRLPDGTLEIVDYKTGNPKEKLDYKEKRQLILYKIALEEGMGEKVSKLSFFYLKNASIVSFDMSDKDEEKLKLDIEKSITEINTGQFPPKPGFLCAYCDFNNICEFRQV